MSSCLESIAHCWCDETKELAVSGSYRKYDLKGS